MSIEKKELEQAIDEKIEEMKVASKVKEAYNHPRHKPGKTPTLEERARPGYLREGD